MVRGKRQFNPSLCSLSGASTDEGLKLTRKEPNIIKELSAREIHQGAFKENLRRYLKSENEGGIIQKMDTM